MPPSPVEIAGRPVGPGHPAFVIAELSGNHRGSLELAKELVLAAAEAGADAVKLQHYTPDMLTLNSDQPSFRISTGTIWDGRTLHDLYREASTPWEWTAELFATARGAGIECLSTPFGTEAIDFLESFDPPAHKIASFEAVDLELVRAVASCGRPVIASTGLCTLREIDDLVRTVRGAGNHQLVLLRCNSAYPAIFEELDLRTIPHMLDTWNVPVGLSDHTLGSTSTVAAVTLGACVVEKHITIKRADGGPDAAFSLEPDEFADLVTAIRDTEKALGTVRYGPTKRESASLVFRRSLFFVRDLTAGDLVDAADVRSIRPGHGLAPSELHHVLGRRVAEDTVAGTPVTIDLLR